MSAPDTDRPATPEPAGPAAPAGARPTITAADLPPSPPPRRRGIPGLRSMVLSMVVLLAMMFVLYAIVARPDKVDRLPVDAVAAVQNARQLSKHDFSALDPQPAGWTSNNATYEPGPDGTPTWSVGYVHGDRYAGLKQAAGVKTAWYAGVLSDFTRDGQQQLDGATWERWVNRTTNEHRLVKRATGQALATVLVSSVSYDDAAAFAARLTPKP